MLLPRSLEAGFIHVTVMRLILLEARLSQNEVAIQGGLRAAVPRGRYLSRFLLKEIPAGINQRPFGLPIPKLTGAMIPSTDSSGSVRGKHNDDISIRQPRNNKSAHSLCKPSRASLSFGTFCVTTARGPPPDFESPTDPARMSSRLYRCPVQNFL